MQKVHSLLTLPSNNNNDYEKLRHMDMATLMSSQAPAGNPGSSPFSQHSPGTTASGTAAADPRGLQSRLKADPGLLETEDSNSDKSTSPGNGSASAGATGRSARLASSSSSTAVVEQLKAAAAGSSRTSDPLGPGGGGSSTAGSDSFLSTDETAQFEADKRLIYK